MKLPKKWLAAFIVIILGIVLFFYLKQYYDFLTDTVSISPTKTLLSWNSIRKVDEQVNILILGIPGGHHDGPNLSDSIMVANYNIKKNRLVTISIPRDIWSDTLRDRLNSAYAYGEDKEVGGGFKLAKAEVSAIYGLPIQYAAVINFSGFDELVDYLGGVDVDVQRAFTDEKFPIEGKENDLCNGDEEYTCRYETVMFEKGKQHMNGKRALTFVRSRNAIGDEGSDFARSQRQQQVIQAMRDKLTSTAKNMNVKKITNLYKNIDAIVKRDITNQQITTLGKHMVFKKDFYQKNFHLPHEAFEVPDYRLYDGKYVLVPRSGDYSSIHSYIECLMEKEDEGKCTSLIEE